MTAAPRSTGALLETMPRGLVLALAVLASLGFAAGAALFGWAGTFARFWADDYCYSAEITLYGLPRAFVSWFQFSGNRLSTLVPVALSDLFGIGGIRAVPALVLAGWGVAFFLFARQLARRLGWQISVMWWLPFAAAWTYFAALLAPDRLQTVYWRMGTLHYSLPVPLLLLHMVFLLRSSGTGGARWLAAEFSLLLAFFTAGFSETFAALQAGLFGLCLLVAVWRALRQQSAPLVLFLPGLLGTLLMMGLMLLSPSNLWRQAAQPPPDNVLLVVPYTLRYSLDFVFYTLRGQIVPFGVLGMFAAAITLASGLAMEIRCSNRALLRVLIGGIAGAYILIVCSFAPSAYAGLAYPAGRALMPAFAVLLLAMMAAVAAAAVLLARGVRWRWLPLAALLLALVLGLYPLRGLQSIQIERERMAVWAERWDARDAGIHQQESAGLRDVQVQEIEVVRTLEDIGPDASRWVNVCAALYYDLSTISAVP